MDEMYRDLMMQAIRNDQAQASGRPDTKGAAMSTTDLDRQREEVRELQADLQRKRLENLPNEYESHVDVTDAAGDKDKEVEITAFGGVVYMNTHGVARFDRESLIAFRKRLDRAFQVV